MNISDPIADMLTRVRNASRARHTEVVVPASRTKREIARILKDEGFIADVDRGAGRALRTVLQHDPQVRRRQGAGRLRAQADQQARPACLRAQDRHPARAGRPRHRHRQHQPGDHDRRAGPQGRSSAAKSSRTSGRREHVTNWSPSHPRPVRCRRRHRRPAASRSRAPRARSSRALHAGHADQPGGRDDPGHPTDGAEDPQAAPWPDPDARQQHGRRRDRRATARASRSPASAIVRCWLGASSSSASGYSHPDRDRPAGRHQLRARDARPSSPSSGIDKELVGQMAAKVRATPQA